MTKQSFPTSLHLKGFSDVSALQLFTKEPLPSSQNSDGLRDILLHLLPHECVVSALGVRLGIQPGAKCFSRVDHACHRGRSSEWKDLTEWDS